MKVYLWSDESQQWRARVTSSIIYSFFWVDSLHLEFCYLANTLDSCTVHSLRFPFVFALLLSKDRILPNTPKSLWTTYVVTLPSLCASLPSICLSFFSYVVTDVGVSWSSPHLPQTSRCILCTHFYPIPYSVLTPSFLTANFSSQYNHALGSIISKNLHSEAHLPPPFLPRLAFSLHL